MADLIERSAAVDAVNESLKRVFVYPVGEKILGKVPSAQQWIPCSERLPGIGVTVLVWVYHDYYLSNLHSIDHVLYWDFDEFDLTGDEFGDVVAWMPLPEWKGET